MLRFLNYLLREPRVPLGLLEKYVLPPFEDAFLASIGFATFGFPAEPWFLGFFPPESDFFFIFI
jgi:hypothetical protein